MASATVSASQQIGGSLGTALLSTLAASAASSYLGGGRPSSALLAAAATHGYTTAFAWAGAIFLVGAIVSGLLFERGLRVAPAAAGPVLTH